MAKQLLELDAVSVDRIFLHTMNPRFEPVSTEAEAIEQLCKFENVYPLAEDIVLNGINPLERVALVAIPAKGQAAAARKSFTVVEGNRRICALKLLNDPDLAPANLRPHFQKLSNNWRPIKSVPAVVFPTIEAVDTWLLRMHQGPQSGIGRKDWNSEQKQRHSGDNKNKLAQAFLDYAEESGFITKDARKGKLTTVSRFVTKESIQEAMGIDPGTDEFRITRPKDDFDKLAKKFTQDLLSGREVNSRMNKREIVKYSRKLISGLTISGQRIDPAPPKSGQATNPGGKGKAKPNPPPPPKFVPHEVEIEDGLTRLKNYKLQSLYHSITTLAVSAHAPLIAVGMWSFFETLTALCGRQANTDFNSYLSNDRLAKMGLGNGKALGGIRTAIKSVQELGNNTKHDKTAAAFNGTQLYNDMETLKDLVIKCIELAETQKG